MTLPSVDEVAGALGLKEAKSELSASPFGEKWPALVETALGRLMRHGRFEAWWETIHRIPMPEVQELSLNRAAPLVSARETLSSELLHDLGPWKKGPFDLMGVFVDAEWRSDLKWERVKSVATPFRGRRVLDVGTGNGYFLLRASGEGARFTLGVEPSAHYAAQFMALARCYQRRDIALLPVTSAEFPQESRYFDTVLSMGVIYHRRSPLDHLAELRSFLRPGGELILETIVVPGEEGYSLMPRDRYAQMRNVWFLPTIPTLTAWLRRLGFENIRVTNAVATTTAEQRATQFSPPPSLLDFLDPSDSTKTTEGYPAPKRAIWIAQAP